MKKLILALVLFVAPLAMAAEQADMSKTVKDLVKEINISTIQGKYDRVIALTHPKAVEQMGGATKAMESMAKTLYELGREGYLMKSVTVGDPLPMVSAGGKIYVATPFTIEIVTKNQDQILNSNYVVGVSDDGEKWVFVNGNPDIRKVKEILPDLPGNLQLPKPVNPTIRTVSERVKILTDELKKVDGDNFADSQPARELEELGLSSVEYGLLDMLIDNDAKVRRRGEAVMAATLKLYFGYRVEDMATADRLAKFEAAWRDNGNYWSDLPLEERNKSYEKWKKWLQANKPTTQPVK